MLIFFKFAKQLVLVEAERDILNEKCRKFEELISEQAAIISAREHELASLQIRESDLLREKASFVTQKFVWDSAVTRVDEVRIHSHDLLILYS